MSGKNPNTVTPEAYVKLAAIAAVVGVALYSAVEIDDLFHQDGLSGRDTCTDVSHEWVPVGDDSNVEFGLISKDWARKNIIDRGGDNRTWTSVARTVSADRGYSMSAARLMEANPRLVITQKSDAKSDEIQAKGPTCIDLPGPIVWGLEEADGHETLEDIATNNTTTVAALDAKNPGLSDNPKAVPKAGTVIEVGLPQVDSLTDHREPFDSSLVLGRLASSTINKAYTDNPKERNKVVLANADKLGAGMSIQQGDTAFVPYVQTPYMKKHGITPSNVINTYEKNYQQPNVEQNIPANPNVATPANYELNNKQLAMIDALDISASDKQFIRDVLPVIMSRTKGGDHWNPVAIMAIAIDESGWGSSEIARAPIASNGYNGGYNLFGVKAGSDWTGPTMNANGNEENGNGSRSYGDYSWRKYKNYQEAVDDYALLIGNLSWFQDSEYCDQTPRQFVEALEYKMNTNTCQLLPGQPYPGVLEPAHATEHNYVDIIINNFVIPYNLQGIVDAGMPVKVPQL